MTPVPSTASTCNAPLSDGRLAKARAGRLRKTCRSPNRRLNPSRPLALRSPTAATGGLMTATVRKAWSIGAIPPRPAHCPGCIQGDRLTNWRDALARCAPHRRPRTVFDCQSGSWRRLERALLGEPAPPTALPAASLRDASKPTLRMALSWLGKQPRRATPRGARWTAGNREPFETSAVARRLRRHLAGWDVITVGGGAQ